jgi:hypothetical protein
MYEKDKEKTKRVAAATKPLKFTSHAKNVGKNCNPQ